MIDRKTALASFCLIAFANPLPAIAACVGPREAAALKVASLQQRLMVAGLACRASDSYNKFVLGHQTELQHSDEDLKDYFIKNGVEADYDTYKTKLANLDAYSEALDHNAFCTATAGDFSSLAKSGDLMAAIAGERLIVGDACEAPMLAAVKPAAAPPVRVAVADPVVAAPVLATVKPAAAPAVRVALADTVVAAPDRQPPAMPYAEAPPPAPSLQPVSASRDDYADARPSQPLNAADRYDEANNVPPRPSALSQISDDRYWYYRWVYSQPGAYAGYYGH